MAKAVFLDRDGTLIRDVHYLTSIDQIEILPGAIDGLQKFSDMGFLLVIVTNQSAIGRGMMSEEELHEIHVALRETCAAKGIHFTAIYYCPTHPEATVEAYRCESEMRKPAPGMLLKAAEDHAIDLAVSVMIGDSQRDIEAGKAAACKTILIGTETDLIADCTVVDLLEAARWIEQEMFREI